MSERSRPHLPDEDLAGAGTPFDLEWQIVLFSEITGRPLQPGQIIEGIPTISAYDDVERQIVLALLRAAHPGEELPMGHIERKLNDDAISKQLRPEGFNANLANGRATILPFDADLAIEYQPNLKKRLQARMKNGLTPGIRVVYEGDLMRGLKPTQVGSVSQDVIYFYDTPATSPDLDHLYCVLGPTTARDEAGRVMGKIVTRSQRRAGTTESQGRRDADKMRASAGSPGLGGKRK